MNDMHLISARAEAQRYCDRHDITDPESCARVERSVRHRMFLECIEPIEAQKRHVFNLFMATQTSVLMIRRGDGQLEAVPPELPPATKEILGQLDNAIIAEAQRWGFDTSQLSRGAESR